MHDLDLLENTDTVNEFAYLEKGLKQRVMALNLFFEGYLFPHLRNRSGAGQGQAVVHPGG